MKNTTQTDIPKFFKRLQWIGIIGLSLLVVNFIYQVWHHTHRSCDNSANAVTTNCQ